MEIEKKTSVFQNTKKIDARKFQLDFVVRVIFNLYDAFQTKNNRKGILLFAWHVLLLNRFYSKFNY